MNIWKLEAGSNVARSAATFCLGFLLMGGGCAVGFGQSQANVAGGDRAAADAQTESNVVIALDSWTELKGQQIAATTVDGDVTLRGTVKDTATKELAERVADRISGVRSVVNELTIADASQAGHSGTDQEATLEANPSQNQAQDLAQVQAQDVYQNQAQPQNEPQTVNIAPAQYPPAQDQQPGAVAPLADASPDTPPPTAQPMQNSAPLQTAQDQGQPQNNAPYAYPSGPAPRPYPDQGNDDQGSANQAGQNQAGQGNGEQGRYPETQQAPNRQSNQRPYDGGSYGNPPAYGNPPYDGSNNDRRDNDRRNNPGEYGNQTSGPVTLPSGTMLRVRTSDFLDARRLQSGGLFDVTAANDVFVGGVLAVPRGAVLQGVVTDLKAGNSGSMTGASSLTLKLTSLNLEGRSYSLDTDSWTGQGPGKGAYSANNTIGGAAVGAVIGAIIGRGPGAAIGAVAGGATGAAASSASAGPRMVLAPETILTFHLTQPVTVNPVSYQEAQRLAAGNQPAERRYLRPRGYYPPPPPPPPYYGPRYYYYGRGW